MKNHEQQMNGGRDEEEESIFDVLDSEEQGNYSISSDIPSKSRKNNESTSIKNYLCETQYHPANQQPLSQNFPLQPAGMEFESHQTSENTIQQNKKIDSKIEQTEQTERKKNPKKGDQAKNVSPNFYKTVVKAYASREMSQIVEKIHRRFHIQDSAKAISFFVKKIQHLICLAEMKEILNYEEEIDEEQRLFKKVFYVFFLWFSRNKYPIHILNSPKIKYPLIYIRCKNEDLYLPEIKPKLKMTRDPNNSWERYLNL